MEEYYIFLALFIGFLGGLSPVIHKTLLHKYNQVTIIVLSSFLYASCSLFYGIYYREVIINDLHKITTNDFLIIAFTAIITAFFANILYYNVLKKHDSHIISALIYSSPIFTLILAYLFLHEKIHFFGGLGIFLILFGVISITYNDRFYQLETIKNFYE